MFKFLDDGIPENDFDRQLLDSNLVGAINLIELNKFALNSFNLDRTAKNFSRYIYA